MRSPQMYSAMHSLGWLVGIVEMEIYKQTNKQTKEQVWRIKRMLCSFGDGFLSVHAVLHGCRVHWSLKFNHWFTLLRSLSFQKTGERERERLVGWLRRHREIDWLTSRLIEKRESVCMCMYVCAYVCVFVNDRWSRCKRVTEDVKKTE